MGNGPFLFFDLDGVLLDSESDLSWLRRSIQKTLAYFHVPLTEDTMSHLHFENIGQFRKISRTLDIDPDILWPIRNSFYIQEKLEAMQQRIIKPFSDINALYELNDGYNFGIISNSPQIIVDEFVSEFDLSDLFTLNSGRGNSMWDIEHLKPDPHLYLKIKERIKTKVVSYVGDRETDREFARNIKMTYYHVNRIQQGRESYSNLYQLIEILKNGNI